MAQPFAVLMTTNQKPEEERYGVSKIYYYRNIE